MKFLIVRQGRDLRFEKLWEGFYNPFLEWPESKIKNFLAKKFGRGYYYRVFKSEVIGYKRSGRPIFGSTTIFSGWVR